eukprot:scaffold1440_cov23-Cyclotella_meneghiniana.AAC.2
MIENSAVLETALPIGEDNSSCVVESKLLAGEKVAVSTRRVLSRKGRCVVRVRVVGDASLGWLDAAQLWGASVEAFVCHGGNIKHLVENHYPDVYVAPMTTAMHLLPHRSWDGIAIGTIENQEDACTFRELVKAWMPAVVIMTGHCSISRSKFHEWTDLSMDGYEHTSLHRCSHQDFGGVTASKWKVAFSWRSSFEDIDFSITRMTASLYPRYLQTALDDTLGAEGRSGQLEVGNSTPETNQEGVIGVINKRELVMDGKRGSVDLSQLKKPDLHRLWVYAVSVFSDERVLRKLTLLELLAIWDYAGKIRYKGLQDSYIWELLHHRLRSPPAKMLTSMMFTVCQQMLEKLMPVRVHSFHTSGDRTAVVKLGLLETKGIQRAKAALPDDAGIELSYWALPNETDQQTHARALLRNFAHLWWVYNLAREAYAWLAANGNHPEDREGIEDCIRRAKGSDYWDWHRGSRLFFWRFPEECGWRKDARDGVEFWHLAKPPTGMHFQNIPASSREAEIQLRTKVFQLYFRRYLEPGPPDLITPRFSVEKVASEDGKVLDIRGVWDAKRNGLNATLWCPGFALPTTQDGADLTVKWLTVPVEEYLRRGSPPQDYTQDQRKFIKSFFLGP